MSQLFGVAPLPVAYNFIDYLQVPTTWKTSYNYHRNVNHIYKMSDSQELFHLILFPQRPISRVNLTIF